MQATIGDIDGCEYLYLEFAYEGGDHRLRLLMTEAELTDKVTPLVIGGIDFAPRSIEHTTDCRCFEVTWPSTIAYSIRNESYCGRSRYEEFNGRNFGLYAKSHYLAFVSAATVTTQDYPGSFKHWGIFTLNHVIDVVSTDDPDPAAEGIFAVAPVAEHPQLDKEPFWSPIEGCGILAPRT